MIELMQDPNHRKYKERIETIEELYKKSLSQRFKHSIDDIKKLIKPVLDYGVGEDKVIDKYEISQYYDWHKSPSFSIKLYIHEDEFSDDYNVIKSTHEVDRAKYRQFENEFYRIRKSIRFVVNKIDFESNGLIIESFGDNMTHIGDLNYFYLRIKEK